MPKLLLLALMVIMMTATVNSDLIPTWSYAMVPIQGGVLARPPHQGLSPTHPQHKIRVKAFSLDRSPVTTQQFRQFVASTGHITDAEREGNSAVLSLSTGRWRLMPNANWQQPLGAKGGKAKANHPVVHVTWYDANNYCQYYGLAAH